MKVFRKNNLFGLIVITVSTFILANTSFAAVASEDGAQPFNLGEIVVSGENTGQEGPTTVTEITSADIEKYNAANLGDALKLVPGVHLRQGRTKEGFYITVRGYEQEKVMILLDGIPIGVPYEGLVNLSDIPVENIAKIKVIKGNASVLYGPNAVGGVVNVITKKGGDTPSYSATYKVSDYNTHHISATHGAQKGKFSYFIGGSHQQSDGWKLSKEFSLPQAVMDSMAASPANPPSVPNIPIAPDSGKRENSDYQKNSITFTGTLDATPDNTLGISMEYYNHEYGLPPVPIIRDHRRGIFYFPRYWRFTDWERFTANLIDEYRISPEFRVKARLFYDDYDNTLNAYDGPDYSAQNRIGPPSGPGNYDDYSSGAQVQAFWDVIKGNQIRFGFNFKRDVHKENFLDGPFDTFISQTYSLALEDEYRVSDMFTVTAGASYDKFDKKKKDIAGSTDDDPGRDIEAFSPQIGFEWFLTDNLNVFGSAAKKVRFPTMRNLYADGIIGPEGNPDLKEEKAYNYDLGLASSIHPKIQVEATVFYNDIENLINFDNILGRFEQYDSAEIFGYEINVSTELAERLVARLSYTFLKTVVNSSVVINNDNAEDLVYQPDKLPYRPKHKIDLDLTKQFGFGLEVDLNGSYIGKQRYYDHYDPADNTHLVSYPKWLDDYFIFNLKIKQKVTDWSEIFIAGENIFNETYEDISMIPGKGRLLWAGINLRM